MGRLATIGREKQPIKLDWISKVKFAMKKEKSLYNYCTSNTFKTDISQLCEKCPLVNKITNGIKDQILFKAKEQQSILTDIQFQDYINAEILNAQDAMKVATLEEDRRTKYSPQSHKDHYLKNRIELYIWNKERIKALNNLKTFPEQHTEKPKPELNEALISFSSTEIIESLHNELKGYFQGKEAELKRALQGKQLQKFLLFPHNQNKFVEVFKRLKYNGFLLSTPKETKDWICATFTYKYQKGNKKEVRKFNTSTVHDILTKDRGEPTKKERICIVDWLPYKSHLTRQREAEKESI